MSAALPISSPVSYLGIDKKLFMLYIVTPSGICATLVRRPAEFCEFRYVYFSSCLIWIQLESLPFFLFSFLTSYGRFRIFLDRCIESKSSSGLKTCKEILTSSFSAGAFLRRCFVLYVSSLRKASCIGYTSNTKTKGTGFPFVGWCIINKHRRAKKSYPAS